MMGGMRADARANRQDLLAAAGRLLEEQGAAMSLRGVAQEAGVGVGTLYRHFPTRRDLLDAVLEDVVARVSGILHAFLDGGGSADRRWRRLAEELAAVNLTSFVTAGDDLEAADRPQEALIVEAEQVIISLTDRAVTEARRAGLVASGVTGTRYLTGLLAVTRPPAGELLARHADQRDWLLGVYLRGLRP